MLLDELPPVLLAQIVYSDQCVLWSGVPVMTPDPESESPDGNCGDTSHVSIEGPEYRGCRDMLLLEGIANSFSDHVTVRGGRLIMWKETWIESPPAELFAQMV